MIFKSFLFSSLSFSMRIINSVVVVRLYYGFLTTFSIGPSQIFFLQSWIREEGDICDYWRFHYGAAHDLHIDLLSTSVSILSQLNRWKIYPIWLYYIISWTRKTDLNLTEMHDLHRYHFSLKGGIAIFEPFPIREWFPLL